MNFSQLEKLDNDNDERLMYQIIDDLSNEDRDSLKKIIMSWNKTQMSSAHEILKDYENIQVSDNVIREILSKNLLLAYELFTDGIWDTCQRRILIDSVYNYFDISVDVIGLKLNPYKDSKEIEALFHEEVKKAANRGDLILLNE